MKESSPVAIGINDFPESLGGRLKDVILLFDNLEDHGHRRTEDAFPLKTEDVIFVMMVGGECRMMVNMEEVTVRKGQVLGIMPNSVFMARWASDDMRFCCFSMASDLYDSILKTVGLYISLPERYARFTIVDCDEKSVESSLEMYAIMKRELLGEDYPTKKMVMERYCEILLLKCIYRLDTHQPSEQPELVVPRRVQIYRDFLSLLEQHFLRERNLAFYASQLCLTPKYLSTVVREVSGKHGAQWIDEYVTMEAKAMLRQGRYNIKQVSDALHFSSQSMFGRFFKKMPGYTPKEYKQL